MASKKPTKNRTTYECSICNFVTVDKKDYNRHLLRPKHKRLVDASKKPQIMLVEKTPDEYVCGCGKLYKHQSSYYRHTRICSMGVTEDVVEEEEITKPTTSEDKSNPDLVSILIKENQDFRDIIAQQNDLLHQQNKTTNEIMTNVIELAKEGKTINNNTNNNTINNNQQFNLNFFLNETCKDAMNITDFIKSIQLNVQDLEKVGELGYAEGISRLLVRGLNELEVTKRPIHCSDLKRETLHIKDQDKWEKDNSNQDMLKKAIKDLSNRNIMLFDDWQKLNPGYDQYDNKNNDIYLKMLVQAMGPHDEVAERRDFGKIIRRVAKTTIIDKETC